MNFSIIIFFVLCLQLSIKIYCYKSYKNAFLVKIQSEEAQSLYELTSIAFVKSDGTHKYLDLIDATEMPTAATFIVPESIQQNVFDYLYNSSWNYEIIENNLDRYIKFEQKMNRKQYFRSRFQRMGNSGVYYYMRYNEIREWLKQKARQTSFMEFEVIGKTEQDNELMLIKLVKDDSKPIIWIDAGIHAREWISPSTAIYIINQLTRNTKEAEFILKNYQVYMLPLLNPDGYEYTHTVDRLWRKNRAVVVKNSCIGIDLNRNFPYKWGGRGASNDPCSDTYRGETKMSEKETESMIKRIKTIKSKIQLFLTLHSFGQYILTPYGYSSFRYPRNYYKIIELGTKVAAVIQEKFGRHYRIGSSSNLLYEASGASDDFAAGELRIPYTYTFELPDTGRYGFILPPTYIKSVGNQMWHALNVMSQELLNI